MKHPGCNNFKSALIICLLSGFLLGNEKKLLLIGIDGCRTDALISASTPNIDKLIEDGKINTAGYKVPIGWRFYSAYPINIGALDLASDATDQPLTFDVDFTYESYSVIKYKRGQLDDIYKREDLGDLADVILV